MHCDLHFKLPQSHEKNYSSLRSSGRSLHVIPALCLERSPKKTGLEYVDLYLMHWPIAFVTTTNLSEAIPSDELGKDGIELLDFSAQKPVIDKEYSENLHLIWKKMEDIYRQGKAKSLGVSNFSIKNLEKLHPT